MPFSVWRFVSWPLIYMSTVVFRVLIIRLIHFLTGMLSISIVSRDPPLVLYLFIAIFSLMDCTLLLVSVELMVVKNTPGDAFGPIVLDIISLLLASGPMLSPLWNMCFNLSVVSTSRMKNHMDHVFSIPPSWFTERVIGIDPLIPGS